MAHVVSYQRSTLTPDGPEGLAHDQNPGGFVTQRTMQRRDRLHRWLWALIDSAIWFLAIYIATWLRFDFEHAPLFVEETLIFALAAATLHLFVGAFIGPYSVGHDRGSFEETSDISRTVIVTTGLLSAWALFAEPQVVARSIPVGAGAVALIGMFAIRFLIRSWRSRHVAAQADERRVIIFGAGDPGHRAMRMGSRHGR